MDVQFTWIPTWHQMDHGHLDNFLKSPLGGRPNTKLGDHGTLNAHDRWFILFYHVWGSAWIEIHWNNTLVTGPVTYDFTLHLRIHDHPTYDFGGVLIQHLDTFFWALTILYSGLLARVWSGNNVMCFSLVVIVGQRDYTSTFLFQEQTL